MLAALKPDDQVPYALAFYAGLHRAEISELEWNDVDLDGFRLHVRKAKSEAGTDRRPPIAQIVRPILRAAWLRHGQPVDGAVNAVSVMSGELAIRATKAWKHAPMALERITLYECRHTYASFLMAAGYTLKEIMEYMGHSKPRHGPALREAAAAARGNRPGPAAQRLRRPGRRRDTKSAVVSTRVSTRPRSGGNLKRPRQDSNLGPAD